MSWKTLLPTGQLAGPCTAGPLCVVGFPFLPD